MSMSVHDDGPTGAERLRRLRAAGLSRRAALRRYPESSRAWRTLR